MAKLKGAITVEKNFCKGCELCIEACPKSVLALTHKEVNEKGYHYAYMAQPDECIGCAICGEMCPDGCITVYRTKQ